MLLLLMFLYFQFALLPVCSLQYLQCFSKNIQLFQFIAQAACCAEQKKETLNV